MLGEELNFFGRIIIHMLKISKKQFSTTEFLFFSDICKKQMSELYRKNSIECSFHLFIIENEDDI